MAYPHFDLVQKAHQDLLAEGKIGPRSSQEEVEQDKGLMCRRAAYYVNTQRDPNHGIMEKTEGNNSQGYSVDWILDKQDGEGWDVTTDDGVNAMPVNGDSHGPNADNIPRWRMPTAELAQISEVEPEPEPEPEETDEILDAIQASQEAIVAAIEAGTQTIMNELHRIVEEAEETLKQILVGYLVLRDPEEEQPPAEEDTNRILLIKLLQHLKQPERTKKGKK